MTDAGVFRGELLRRLLKATGATSTGIALAASCGGKTADLGRAHVGDFGNTGGASASVGGAVGTGADAAGGGELILDPPPPGPPNTEEARYCLHADPVMGADGGRRADAGLSLDAGRSTADGGRRADAGLSFDAGRSAEAGSPADASRGPTDDVHCPPASELELAEVLGTPCDGEYSRSVLEVSEAKIVDHACCYDAVLKLNFCGYVGRAFLVDEGFLKSTARPGGGWRTGPAPHVASLSKATRRALSAAWEKDGLFEHASVATFSRFAIQLLAVGAPSSLLHETLAAGDDEIRHAELCFALASAYHGTPLEPDRFPIGDALALDRDLQSIVAETVVEGCIGETLAAMQAAAQLRCATDPAVVAALEATVEDETRHAELAWRVVAWAVRQGGRPVEEVAARTFAAFRPPSPPAIDLSGVDLDAFARHGRLTPEAARAAALDALDRVVRPCAAALLERDVIQKRPTTAAFD